jgi:hypothetical protein
MAGVSKQIHHECAWGWGVGSPPPFSVDDAFRKLINNQGKKIPPPEVPKFIKKLDVIPEITLPEEQPIKIPGISRKRVSRPVYGAMAIDKNYG